MFSKFGRVWRTSTTDRRRGVSSSSSNANNNKQKEGQARQDQHEGEGTEHNNNNKQQSTEQNKGSSSMPGGPGWVMFPWLNGRLGLTEARNLLTVLGFAFVGLGSWLFKERQDHAHRQAKRNLVLQQLGNKRIEENFWNDQWVLMTLHDRWLHDEPDEVKTDYRKRTMKLVEKVMELKARCDQQAQLLPDGACESHECTEYREFEHARLRTHIAFRQVYHMMGDASIPRSILQSVTGPGCERMRMYFDVAFPLSLLMPMLHPRRLVKGRHDETIAIARFYCETCSEFEATLPEIWRSFREEVVSYCDQSRPKSTAGYMQQNSRAAGFMGSLFSKERTQRDGSDSPIGGTIPDDTDCDWVIPAMHSKAPAKEVYVPSVMDLAMVQQSIIKTVLNTDLGVGARLRTNVKQ